MALTDKLTAIADAIRGKTGKTDGLTLDQMATEIAGIEAGGGGDNPLDYANNITQMFQSNVFDKENLYIAFGSKATVNLNSGALNKVFYRASGVKSIELCYEGNGNSSSLNAFAHILSLDGTLERIVFSGSLSVLKTVDCYRAFYNRAGLREIVGELNMTNSSNTTYVSDMFFRCEALETVRFTAGSIKVPISFAHSYNLTDATIQNIIDALADKTGGTAQTLTLHATVGAKLTDAQKSAASAKNWTISY